MQQMHTRIPLHTYHQTKEECLGETKLYFQTSSTTIFHFIYFFRAHLATKFNRKKKKFSMKIQYGYILKPILTLISIVLKNSHEWELLRSYNCVIQYYHTRAPYNNFFNCSLWECQHISKIVNTFLTAPCGNANTFLRSPTLF